MNIEYIKKLIVKIGFVPENGKNAVYVKQYPAHNNYAIYVDFNECKIEYACQSVEPNKRIRIGDLTTSNFDKSENFVVLECVDRLLTKGYSPNCLELEKKYPLGRNLKGKLDILVYDETGSVPFLMVECKTWGTEYEKELSKTLKDGGQIFSYYQQDKAAKYLCLYASHLDKKEIEYRNSIVLVEDSWHDLSSAKDVFDYWNKNFKDNGIFEAYTTPYDIKPKALTYGMLKNLKEEDSGKIYNQIMEILRHNAISDKPNAFNKLLNLFVCKIIDENQNPDDELRFQWLDSDTDESLQMRLNDLYKDGMWRFLEIKIIDHSEDDVSKVLEGIDNPIQKQQLIDMFRDARLKKSPNFAFLEVLDEKTFKLNAKIIREIVELLQVYKFRYQQKHEFLGNFFELLLNTSMKQEAGQYFTPVPITRFIISSLPLKEFVQNKIDSRERDILPAVIDYACGSGHFLTEYMDQMQTVVDSKIDVSKATPDVKNLVKTWRDAIKFAWAKDYVYGIDLDNRLVKTAKVSAFFNGDGEANIIWANGLDSFEKSDEYRDLLRHTQPYDKQNNGQFDILISNPPYSVEAFKSTLKHGDESFSLYDSVTDNSSEIECLFVERMKQLLKVGGWAGVVLPSSILSNGGIYSRTREIIFKYFNIKAIVELGSGTFMKTNTNTVVLFLERRSDNDYTAIEKAIDTFVDNLKDVTVLGIENAFSKYVANVYDDLSFDDYVSFLSGSASDSMQNHELFSDYKKAFGDELYAKAILLEKEKMLYFLLTYPQNIVLVKTGNKKEEKNFLGYEFSERRGHEGLKQLPGGTKLFDETGDLTNSQKANSYIYQAFLGKKLDIDEKISKNVTYRIMSDLIIYGTNKFDRMVNLNKVPSYSGKWCSDKTENLMCPIIGAVTKIPQKDILDTGSIPVITQDSEKFISGYCNNNKPISDVPVILMGDHTCVFKWIEVPFVRGADNTQLIKFDDSRIIPKYGYYYLKNAEIYNKDKYERHFKYVKELKIPIPSINIQQKIVSEFETAESQESTITAKIKKLKSSVTSLMKSSFSSSKKPQKLGSVAQYSQDRISCAVLTEDTFVGVDNLLQNMEGKTASQFVPTVGTSTAYTEGDILLSNIRPYLKKIWLADNDGGSSGDVLVLKPNNTIILSDYLYYQLANDEFFDYEMQHIKGQKMPRADKSEVLNYPVYIPSIDVQKKTLDEIVKSKNELDDLKKQLQKLEIIKEDILKTYL